MPPLRLLITVFFVFAAAACVDQQDLGRDGDAGAGNDASDEGMPDGDDGSPGDGNPADAGDGDELDAGDSDSSESDAGSDDGRDGGSAPEPTTCDPTAPFVVSTGFRLWQTGEIDSAEDAWLSPDQRKLFFSQPEGTFGTPGVLYEQRRADTTGVFSGTKVLFTPQEGDFQDTRTETYGRRPTLSADLLTLYYVNTYGWLMTSVRADEDDMFPTPSFVSFDEESRGDASPSFALDDEELWFAAQHADVSPIPGFPGGGDEASNYDLMRVSLTREGAKAVPVSELNSEVDDESPVLSADGLWIYFRSSRPHAGDPGSFALFEAHRDDTDEAFGHITEMLDFGNVTPVYLSPDYCSLYYLASGGVYEARRQQ